MKTAFVLALGALAVAAMPALAQKPTQGQGAPANDVVTSVTADLVGSLLDEQGISYEEGIDSYDDPILYITAKNLATNRMNIQFYGCDGGQPEQCGSILIWSNYSFSGNDATANLNKINEWNRNARWTRAYVDSNGNATLETDINITGGISLDNVASQIAEYVAQIPEVADAIR